MHSLVRSVLVWLLVLAMPVQGIAAARMQHCAPTHARMQVVGQAEVPMHEHDHAHATADDGQGLSAEATAASSRSAVDTSGPVKAPVSADAQQCSACAACCPTLGLPATAELVPAAPIAAPAAQRSVLAVVAFVTSGPDRPPRVVLA